MRAVSQDSARPWLDPVLLVAVALGFDFAYRRIPFTVLGSGMLDEIAHLATGALGLLVLQRFIDAPKGFYVSALIWSVALDLDHVPYYLGLLSYQPQRPVTHSLLTAFVFICAAAPSRRYRAIFAGGAFGILVHLVRDMAESSQGVMLFWPLERTSWTLSYWCYLGMILAFATARLVLVKFNIPHGRIRLFQRPQAGQKTFPLSGRPVASDHWPSNPEPGEAENASGPHCPR
jgi:membrane-bound metal-dependent hydrolase YbcI (DUF457 family)